MILRRRFLQSGLAIAGSVALSESPAGAQSLRRSRHDPWVVYYRDALPASAFHRYRLAVFDADHHPPLTPLLDRDMLILGYLSLGELEHYRKDFTEAEASGYVLMENPNWPGSHFVDIRDARWTRRIVEQLAPQVWDTGFHGFFLDTLDNPPHLERLDPERYRGMTAAAAELTLALRRAFPTAMIMLNRAYEIHAAVAGSVNFILAESLRARFDAAKDSYVFTPEAEYLQQVGALQRLQARYPDLGIMSLDYWDPADAAGMRRIYALQRRNGFAPYVATPALDAVIPEPR